MLVRATMRRRSRAAWVVVVALAVGVGLIAMHSGVSRAEHAHSSTHAHALVATSASDEASHAPACEGCASHASVAMVCAVLLVAVAGGVAVRLVRRWSMRARVVQVAPAGLLRWLGAQVGALARPPDLHALQVMRC
ncbi:MAG: hypothetical protein GEV08_06085 [Acidimicrobiia bacterium]|nr:hypothetical protein [Acidimicrobiia bacterium]